MSVPASSADEPRPRRLSPASARAAPACSRLLAVPKHVTEGNRRQKRLGLRILRRIGKGSRLRLVLGPVNSKYWEKNYNSGGIVADESGKDAQTVTVTLYHDAAHPSALYLPIAASVPQR